MVQISIFGPIESLISLAKSFYDKGRIQYSEPLIDPLMKSQYFMSEFDLILLTQYVIYTVKHLFSLRMYFKTVLVSVHK